MCSLRLFAAIVVVMCSTQSRAACLGECTEQDASDSYLAINIHQGTGNFVMSENTDEFGDPIKAIVQNAGFADESRPRLVQLESHLEKLVIANATYTATSPEVEALKVVAGFVAQIINATKKGHGENQKELNDALQLVKDCNSAANTAVDGRLKDEAAVMSSAKTTHNSCRVAEVSLKDTRDEKCKTFSDRKESFGLARSSGVGMCSSASDAPTDDAITEGFNWLDDLKTKMDACNGATTIHADKRSACGTNQSNYEKTRCFLKDQTEEVCNGLDSCYGQHTSFMTTRGQAVRKMEAVRKAEHVSAKRVLCYIDILSNNTGNKTEKLQNCRVAVTTSHLSISYPEAPRKYDCVRITDYPCGDEWVRTEYTTQAWHSKANTEACSVCLTSPPTPAPGPIAQHGGTVSDSTPGTFELSSLATVDHATEGWCPAKYPVFGGNKIFLAVDNVDGAKTFVYDTITKTARYTDHGGDSGIKAWCVVGMKVVGMPEKGPIVIYDSETNTVQLHTDPNVAITSGFYGCATAGNKVYAFPCSIGKVLIYDVSANAHQWVDDAGLIGSSMWAGQSAVNGKVVANPLRAHKLGIYDIASGTFSYHPLGNSHNQLFEQWASPVAMGDKALGVSQWGDSLYNYDTVTDTMSVISTGLPRITLSFYYGQVVVGSKLVAMPYYTNQKILVYDTDDDSVHTKDCPCCTNWNGAYYCSYADNVGSTVACLPGRGSDSFLDKAFLYHVDTETAECKDMALGGQRFRYTIRVGDEIIGIPQAHHQGGSKIAHLEFEAQ